MDPNNAIYLIVADSARQLVSGKNIDPMQALVVGGASYASSLLLHDKIKAVVLDTSNPSADMVYPMELLAESLSIASALYILGKANIVDKADTNEEGGKKAKRVKFVSSWKLSAMDIATREILKKLWGGDMMYSSTPTITTVPVKTTTSTTYVKPTYVK